MYFLRLFLLLPLFLFSANKVELGVDVFFKEKSFNRLTGKRVALVTNQSGVNGELTPTYELFLQKQGPYKVVAFFCPEHGFNGSHYAFEKVKDSESEGIPIYSLHGKTRRPTAEMLKGIDLIFFDIQDIGIRSYTYCSTLFYVMEEAAKHRIPVVVFDRPNPMGGELVDGLMLDEKWRSFVGYIDVPYCHGMTIGELARFFNEEYKVQCDLKVIPMKGWKRSMSFQETGLKWIPTSPHIPEPDTPIFCASTGILGELGIASTGVGYTLPFKLVGAPWIDGRAFAEALNSLRLPGVTFRPFSFRPFYGEFRAKECQGVLIVIEDRSQYKPLMVQFALIGILKSLYPHTFKHALDGLSAQKKELFCKTLGTDRVLDLLKTERFVTYKLLDLDKDRLDAFKIKRTKYLIEDYK